METTHKTVTVTLTEAELALVNAKRAKEAAEKKEREAINELMKARKIDEMKKQIVAFKGSKDQISRVTRDFLAELNVKSGGLYQLKIDKGHENFRASNGYWRDEVIFATEVVEYEILRIELVSNPAFYITVDENDFDMKLHGPFSWEDKATRRGYKNVRKVNDKIQDRISADKRAAVIKQNKLTAKEQALAALKEKFPEATVEVHEGEYSSGCGRHSRWITTQNISVTFPNTLSSTVTFGLDSTGKLKLDYSTQVSLGKLPQLEVIEALRGLKLPEAAVQNS